MLAIQNSKLVLTTEGSQNLKNIAYTLQVGREPMEERLAILAKDTHELIKQLTAYQKGKLGNLLTGNIKKDQSVGV